MDYVKYALGSPKIEGKKPNLDDAPFCGSSTYKNNYINWGVIKLPDVKGHDNQIYSLPFKGRTTYTETYRPPDLSYRSRPFNQVYFFYLAKIKENLIQ